MDQGCFPNKPDSGKFSLRRSRTALCPACDKVVELMTFADAAAVFHTDLQDIELLASTGGVHRLHNRRGELMICSISLFECFDNRRTRLLDSHFVEKAAGTGPGSSDRP